MSKLHWWAVGVACAAIASVPARAEPQPATITDIVDAVTACRNSVVPGAVDADLLGRAGWISVTVTSPQTAPDPSELLAFTRPENPVLMLVPVGGAPSLCTVVGRLRASDTYPEALAGLDASLGDFTILEGGARRMVRVGNALLQSAESEFDGLPTIRVTVSHMERAE